MQAQDMRFLGGYLGALFVGAGRVLGEESVRGREERMGEREKEAEDERRS